MNAPLAFAPLVPTRPPFFSRRFIRIISVMGTAVLQGLAEDLRRPDTLLAACVATWLHPRGHRSGAAFAADFVAVFLVLKNLLGV